MRYFKSNNFEPIALNKKISKLYLNFLLKQKRIKKIFCWHYWIEYKFGKATKKHRICSKCFKKEKTINIIKTDLNGWITEK